MSEINFQPASVDDHEWYHSETDTAPLAVAKQGSASHLSTDQEISHEAPMTGRGFRTKQTSKLRESLQQEKLNEWGRTSSKPSTQFKQRTSHKSKKPRTANVYEESTDKEDSNFNGSSSDTESIKSGDDLIPNDEVVSLLPSKSIPEPMQGAKRKHSRTAGKKSAQSANPLSAGVSVASLASASVASLDDSGSNSVAQIVGAATTKTRNSIYYFYEPVDRNNKGELGQQGDKHYKSLHGNRGVFTVTKASRYNLGSLIRNLKTASAPMYSLFCAINGRQATQEEIDLASGKTPFDPSKHYDFIKSIQTSQIDIRRALEKQASAAAGPWDQAKFEQFLAEWMVLTDQPFDTVDNLEFCELMAYVHHPAPELKIPHRDAMKRRIMKMGDDAIESTRRMFA
ncbi:hypothetical protein BYT27DRAFT_7129337, partial [Phlegmacium glaucopus]